MSNKQEVYLEIGTGFFRISTPEVNYNITMINSQQASVSLDVERTVNHERKSISGVDEKAMVALAEGLTSAGTDDFYREVSNEIYRDIGQLAKNLSATILDIPAEDRVIKRAQLDEAGDKIEDAKSQLKDIVEMTEKAAMKIMDRVEDVQAETDNVKNLLLDLKNHPAFYTADVEKIGEGETIFSIAEETKAVQQKLRQAVELLDAVKDQSCGQAAPAELKKEKKRRYLFDIDVVFQTLYELCTNEAVKEHLAKARERITDIFALDAFHDAISISAATYKADSDNFYTVPMSDVFTSLLKACREKGIANLLKKMDAGQSSIFLDQTIPLEVPTIEETEVESQTLEAAVQHDPRLDNVKGLLDSAIMTLGEIPDKSEEALEQLKPGYGCMSLDDQKDIFRRIEDAFAITTDISTAVFKITEALSFQDLSGQQILKIIKLLSDFQIQLIALVVSFGSQLKQKKINYDITPAESKKLAQDDVDSYINKLSSVGNEDGLLDQAAVNKMLEEMGF